MKTLTAKKTVPTVVGVAVMCAMVFAAAAYACTSLATLNLSNSTGPAGTSVGARGAGFAPPARGASPVVLHLDRADGPQLATVTPDAAGNFTTNFTVPETAAPGYHVIVATQTNARGEMAYGTPARAAFQVVGPGATSANPTPAAPPQGQEPGSGSSLPALALTAALGVIGLVLLAAGSATFMRARREGPAAARRR